MMSPSDLLATPVLNAFQNVVLAIIIERQKQTKLLRSMSNKSSFFRSHKMNSTIFSRFLRALLPPFLPAKTKAKHMENGLIFHVTIQIQILTMFSVQSKYSKKTKKYIIVGFRHLQ